MDYEELKDRLMEEHGFSEGYIEHLDAGGFLDDMYEEVGGIDREDDPDRIDEDDEDNYDDIPF